MGLALLLLRFTIRVSTNGGISLKLRPKRGRNQQGICFVSPEAIDSKIEKNYFGKSIRNLPLPTMSYLMEQFQEIKKKYSNSINNCVENSWHKQLLEERLEEAIRLIKIAHNNSKNYTDWFVNIIGTISNIIYDYGYLFINASDTKFKKLLSPSYETLLENQSKYVDSYIELRNQFKNHNLQTPLRDIRNDFVPFFYECNSEECHCRRLELIGNDYPSMIHVKCECSECGNARRCCASLRGACCARSR